LENTRHLMGWNFYTYGIAENRGTLETPFDYAHRQGLASKHLTIDEVFLPGSHPFSETDM